MGPLSLCLLIGSRSDALKLAPLSLACRERRDLTAAVVIVGDDQAGLATLLADLGVPFDWRWEARPGGSLPRQMIENTGRQLADKLASDQFDALVVQGDGVWSAVAALAARTLRIPLVRIDSQRPEENPNRTVVRNSSRLPTPPHYAMHCVSTRAQARLLVERGISRHTVQVVGYAAVDGLKTLFSPGRELLGSRQFVSQLPIAQTVLVDLPSDDLPGMDPLRLCHELRQLASQQPGWRIEVPLPRSLGWSTELKEGLHEVRNIDLLPACSVADWVQLVRRSSIIITDSELAWELAAVLGRAVISLRTPVELHHTTAEGLQSVVGTDSESVAELLKRTGANSTVRPVSWRREGPSPFGTDGRTSERILDLVAARAWNEPVTLRRVA